MAGKKSGQFFVISTVFTMQVCLKGRECEEEEEEEQEKEEGLPKHQPKQSHPSSCCPQSGVGGNVYNACLVVLEFVFGGETSGAFHAHPFSEKMLRRGERRRRGKPFYLHDPSFIFPTPKCNVHKFSFFTESTFTSFFSSFFSFSYSFFPHLNVMYIFAT